MARSHLFLAGGSFERLAEHGADSPATRDCITRFTQGQCAMLAERVHQITGWKMVVLCQRGAAIHWLNRRDDGALVDAHGAVPFVLRSIIERRHVASDPSWRDWGQRFSMEREDVAEVDLFLNGPWMMAVIPPSDRLATPLPIYDADLDEDCCDDDMSEHPQ